MPPPVSCMVTRQDGKSIATVWQVQDSNLRRNAPSDLQTDDPTALTWPYVFLGRTSPRVPHRYPTTPGDSRTGPSSCSSVDSRMGVREEFLRAPFPRPRTDNVAGQSLRSWNRALVLSAGARLVLRWSGV